MTDPPAALDHLGARPAILEPAAGLELPRIVEHVPTRRGRIVEKNVIDMTIPENHGRKPRRDCSGRPTPFGHNASTGERFLS